MNYMDKIAYFRQRDTGAPNPTDNQRKYFAMHGRFRKNNAELAKYTPFSRLARAGGAALTAGALWRVNPWLAIALAPIGGWLTGRVTDDMTGRTKLKSENRELKKYMDSHDTWMQSFDAGNQFEDLGRNKSRDPFTLGF